MKKQARVLITAPCSGSGKTLVTCGLLALLKKKNYSVASVKCGPDYIDPMFHRTIFGVTSGNIDTFFTDENITRNILLEKMENKDITILEGVMGYYDGFAGTSTIASTYEISTVTKTPALLVVDGKGASVTLAATIKGIGSFRSDHQVKGIILNRVSDSYYERIKRIIEEETNIPVLGHIPFLKEMELPSRHLGLVQPEELPKVKKWLDIVAETMEKYLDIEKILSISEAAETLEKSNTDNMARILEEHPLKSIRIAVARDLAFSFYYQENLDLLKRAGAKLIEFSPMYDRELPENIQGLILGGGYPENYARLLSENTSMLKSVRNAITKEKVKCLAECGGFLYLQNSLMDKEDRKYNMAGVLPGCGIKGNSLRHFGYMVAKKEDQLLKGHEFHYWDSTENGNALTIMKPGVIKKDGREILDYRHVNKSYLDMIMTDNLLAGFPHFYFYSNPEFFVSFFEEKAGLE